MWHGRAIVLTALIAGGAAQAADLVSKPPVQVAATTAPVPWLLGDWDGARTALQRQGIDFQFGYGALIPVELA
jgi:porin